MNKKTIVDVLGTLKPEFTITEARNGNFRVQLTPDEMSKLKTEPQWRAFIEAADALREKGLQVELRSAFKGNDGKWVNYPSLWVNETTSKNVDADVIKQAVAAGIAAYKAAQEADETTEGEGSEEEKPAEPVY